MIIKAKNILVKSKLPGADLVINPYVGCTHGCQYCYAEFMNKFYNIEREWGSFAFLKEWEEDLDKSVRKLGSKTILFGSVTDCYQPPEAKFEVMRKLLPFFIDANCQVEIITKSSLILRDLDLLRKIPNITVGVSLASLDDKFIKLVERSTDPPEKRLETLKILSENNLDNFLFVSPIFPEITELSEIIKKASSLTKRIYFENLNLRGKNRNKILPLINHHYPEIFPLYQNIFFKGDISYWENMTKDIERFCKKLGLDFQIFFHHQVSPGTGSTRHIS